MLHFSDGLDGSTMDTMYGWLGAASFFFEIGTSFYQPCNEFSTVINDVFPALLVRVRLAAHKHSRVFHIKYPHLQLIVLSTFCPTFHVVCSESSKAAVQNSPWA